MDQKFILYNKKLISRARELRKARTEAEVLFWNKVLKDKKIIKYKFTQQKPLENFIADFYCSKLLLVIEIDGEIHKNTKGKDRERAKILFYKYGIKVVRYKNSDIINNIEAVICSLMKEIKLREDTLGIRSI